MRASETTDLRLAIALVAVIFVFGRFASEFDGWQGWFCAALALDAAVITITTVSLVSRYRERTPTMPVPSSSPAGTPSRFSPQSAFEG